MSPCVVLLLGSLLAGGPQGGPAPPPNPPPKADARGFVPVGSVRVNPKEKVVEADGYFNLRKGFLEFLACAPEIKSYETLVTLDCRPRDLKAALLLLGLKEARRPKADDDLAALKGDRVMILLRWKTTDDKGKETVHEMRAEDCIVNGLDGEPMEKVGWAFTGSTFVDVPTGPPPKEGAPPPTRQEFAADATGQIVSVCHRPFTILDNPLELPMVDADYYANPEVLPPLNRDDPVRVTMIIRKPKPGEIDASIVRMRVPPKGDREGAGEKKPAAEKPKPGDGENGRGDRPRR